MTHAVQKYKRQSNIELLRIVLMFMIVSLHFLILDVYPQIWDVHTLNEGVVVASILNGFLYIAVNCYILISGYCGIRFRLKTIIRIYSMCFVYGLLAYLLHILIDGDKIGKSLLFNSIFCLSHLKLWYVKCYIVLVIISPILNKAIESFSRKQHQWIILAFTIINVYFGYFWQTKGFSKDGYTVDQFIYLYFIGQYIKRYVPTSWIHSNHSLCLITYCICALLWGGATILSHSIYLPIWEPFSYNNPVLIIGAIAFFLFFLSFTFQSKLINYLATFSFPIYIVHCGNYFSDYLHEIARYVFDTLTPNGIIMTICGIFIMSISTMLLISLLDIVCRKIYEFLSNILSIIGNNIIKKSTFLTSIQKEIE